MKVRTSGKSIVEALSEIAMNALPNTAQSGLSRHLRGSIKSDPVSKGKAILMKWNNNDFKVNENLSVFEMSFCNEWIKTEETQKVETTLKNYVNPAVNTEQEKTEVAIQIQAVA